MLRRKLRRASKGKGKGNTHIPGSSIGNGDKLGGLRINSVHFDVLLRLLGRLLRPGASDHVISLLARGSEVQRNGGELASAAAVQK